jgi:hypothetical protein
MFTIEKRYLVDLQAPGGPGGDSMDVPFLCEEVTQQLAVWVYMPGGTALGAGSVQLVRNGVLVGAAVGFAGNSVSIPVGQFVSGADTEIEMLTPQTLNPTPLAGRLYWDGAAVQLQKLPSAPAKAPPFALAARVINTHVATKHSYVVLWTGLVWRNA